MLVSQKLKKKKKGILVGCKVDEGLKYQIVIGKKVQLALISLYK